MKRVLQIALAAVLSMGAVTMQAQDNWHGDRDGRDRIAHFNNGRNGRHDDRRDSRDDQRRLREQPTRVHYRGR